MINTLRTGASGSHLRTLRILDVRNDILRDLIGLQDVSQLSLRLHLVAENGVEDLLVEGTLGLQMVLPVELLVE